MSRADLALLLICAIWGTTFALLREALHALSPAGLVALRFTIAFVVLAIVYARRLRGWRPEWIRDGVGIGFWLAVGYITQVMGLRTVSASRSAFITSMSIAIVPFVALILLRAKPVMGEVLGVALAVVGLVLFSADAGFSLSPGELWTLVCAVAFAVQIVVTHKAGQRSPAVPMAVAQTAVGALAGWVLLFGGGGGIRAEVPAGSPAAPGIPWGVVLYLAIVATAFIIVVQTWALARTSSVKAGVLYATEPIFAAIFAVSFFAERMTPRELWGAGFILAGVLVSELWRPLRARRMARARPTAGGTPTSRTPTSGTPPAPTN